MTMKRNLMAMYAGAGAGMLIMLIVAMLKG